jgi:tetrahydromethanopterin S-methyltransferase subunit G
MKSRKPSREHRLLNGDIGAAFGLTIGIILGSLLLNFVRSGLLAQILR